MSAIQSMQIPFCATDFSCTIEESKEPTEVRRALPYLIPSLEPSLASPASLARLVRHEMPAGEPSTPTARVTGANRLASGLRFLGVKFDAPPTDAGRREYSSGDSLDKYSEEKGRSENAKVRGLNLTASKLAALS